MPASKCVSREKYRAIIVLYADTIYSNIVYNYGIQTYVCKRNEIRTIAFLNRFNFYASKYIKYVSFKKEFVR